MLKKFDKIWFIIIYFEFKEKYFKKLIKLINIEYQNKIIYPNKHDILNFLRLTPFKNINTIIIGQDPYCKKGQAHGLAFSVRENIQIPGSLKNIFKELHNDIGVNNLNKHGNLNAWAKQGVFLLNSILTVEENNPGAHSKFGWEKFTDKIIQKLSNNKKKLIFVLLGKYASNKLELINIQKHITIITSHPSPMSANNGFLGSRIFSKVNINLKLINDTIKIKWDI